MRHPYLFERGFWNADGIYVDENGIHLPLEGQASVSHGETAWKVSGIMRVLSDPPVEFQNVYDIAPFEPNSTSTRWSSQNPALEELRGNFVVIDVSILSVYRTENNEYTGTEYVRQIGEDHNINRGVLMKGDVNISSWSVDLRRKATVY